MAKVVDYFTSQTTSRCYTRSDPSASNSGVQQYEAGVSFTIENNNGSAWMENGYYRVRSGLNGSWIYWSDVSTPQAVYKTVTDACTAPTSVTLSGKVLTIKGGAGGDLNTFSGYGISWRDKPIGGSYGDWTSDVTVSSSSTTVTYNVTAPAGYVRQFRARTLGSAGSSYYSAYVTCSTTLTGNTAPSAPTINLPTASAVTYSTTPSIKVTVAADADGDTLTLKRKIGNGSWTNVTTIKSGTYVDQLPTLSVGAHIVYYKLADSYAESAENSVQITAQSHSWGRTISTGSVISNASISHRSDINELLTAVNSQRTYYGLSKITLPGTVGRFGDWKSQMEKLLEGINGSRSTLGLTAITMTVPAYPTASTFNALRNASKQI